MSSTGYEFPWERQAMRGEELPEGLSLVEQMAYIALRHIYWQHGQQMISREQAAREKQKLRRTYEMASETLARYEKMLAQQAKVYKETELARSRVRHDPTPENALALCTAIDGAYGKSTM